MFICDSRMKSWTKWLFYTVYGASFLHLGYLLVSGSFFKTQAFQLPAIFIVLSLFIYYVKGIKIQFGALIWLGSISYALYVIHTPIFFAFEYIKFAGGTLFYFILRMSIVLPLVIFLAYLLEKKLQPFVRRVVDAKRKTF
jgi:peptidoglycan/LPS O-acetylase OafA/YrhL